MPARLAERAATETTTSNRLIPEGFPNPIGRIRQNVRDGAPSHLVRLVRLEPQCRTFAYYIAGGRPRGSTRTYVGARDRSAAADAAALETPYQLYFSGESRVWGGSPAFIDTKPVDGVVGFARAYLIGWDQFEDVVAQENGRPSSPIEVDERNLVPGFSRQIGSGRYENLLCTERLDDMPVVTFTAPWSRTR